MSRSKDRITATIERLQESFEKTPYFTEYLFHADDEKPSTRNEILLSCVIPARNEFPNIAHTVHSILNCWEADDFNEKDIEIIIVNNCSTDYNDPKYDWSKPGDRGTTEHLMPRGIYHSRTLRVLYDPIAGNHSARNKGAAMARGKYLFFSDAHMSYKPGAFKYGLEAVSQSGGLVHMGIAWMGGFPPRSSSVGKQYTIKLGQEIKGTWATYEPWGDKWFYIAAQGHCSVLANRKQFLDFGGYPEIHRTYGGGEFYTNMKWWLFGSSVVVEPRAIGYHLASSRGYSYNHDDYTHNVFNMGWAIGADDWLERAYLDCLKRGRKEVVDRMLEEAKKETARDRKVIESRRVCTFNDLLINRPWDKKNMERGGAKNSSLLVFHPTWIDGLKDYPLVYEMYKNSVGMARLHQFIIDNLWDNVYHKDEYDPITLTKKTQESAPVDVGTQA